MIQRYLDPAENVRQRLAERGHAAVPAADYIGDQPGPAGLMGGAEARAVIPVEVLAEHQVVPPGRIAEQFDAAEAGPAPVRPGREDRDEPVLEIGSDLAEGLLAARARRVLDRELVPEELVVALQC